MMTHDTRFPYGLEWTGDARIQCYAVAPNLFGWLMGRTVRFEGLPPDAEYVRSWHDQSTDTFYVVYRSAAFPECPAGVVPCRGEMRIVKLHEEAERG